MLDLYITLLINLLHLMICVFIVIQLALLVLYATVTSRGPPIRDTLWIFPILLAIKIQRVRFKVV